MAVTSIWPIKGRIAPVIEYARNPGKTIETSREQTAVLHQIDGVLEYAADDMKTETREYVSGINCSEEFAAQQFKDTKQHFGKTDGRLCYHGYQSFMEGEVNAQTAHEIGVKLARELWGDRFEVLVATHCNTGHYHNHFVINSVSFTDGLKFYNSHEDYRRMREMSDRLCREARISVIENPKGRGKNYALWEAEKNGKTTLPGMARADFDRAILACTTETAFWRMLREMGYKLILYKKDGKPRDQPSVRAPGALKNVRLSTMGEEYSLERISQRLNQNINKQNPFPEANEEARRKYHYTPEKHPKATGIYALYLHYCYELNILIQHPTSVKRVSSYLREDILKLEKLEGQARLLGRTGITTMDELKAYQGKTEQRMSTLSGERNELRNRLNRAYRQGDTAAVETIKSKVKEISAELKGLRKEAALCDGIAQRSGQIRENLNWLEQERNNDGKEKTTDEHIRRNGRSGRENDAQRR